MIKSMICTFLECGCVVSCSEVGGLIVGCNGFECDFKEWHENHYFCKKCGKCEWCGKCECPGRFGI
jgi:hypothetical protein